MNGLRGLAIALMLAGALGLAYGGFSYTKETHTADVGAMHLAINEEQRVNIPLWLGVGALLLGGVLLVMGKK